MNTITVPLSGIKAVVDAIIASGKDNLLLHGDLGAGKTTLLKERVAALGGDKNTVTSPTYTYMNSYDEKILHIDMRRIETPDQLHELGLLDAFNTHEHSAIERPKREDQYVDDTRLTIHITKDGDDLRTYLLSS